MGDDVTDVLIAGAGPTGLALAVDLARRGVGVRIIDRAAEHFAGSRGKGLQERSLEVLADLGVAEQLQAAGWMLPVRISVGGRLLRESPPGATLILPQSVVEQALRARLAELGRPVELDTALTGFEQSGDGIVATTSRDTIATRYLVGCDGGRLGRAGGRRPRAVAGRDRRRRVHPARLRCRVRPHAADRSERPEPPHVGRTYRRHAGAGAT